jgi:hypothetical protein
MSEFQYWLMTTLNDIDFVEPIMNSHWGWPIVESLHFVGLSLLIGAVGMFDLRLLGFAPGISFASLHRLVPWGVAGYALNVSTGFMFLMSAPDQYIFNPAFHFKILCMMLAGINVAVFYSFAFGRLKTVGPGEDPPFGVRVIGAASLLLWVGVIIFGRLLTFYRPIPCMEGGPQAFLATCL